mmetsp:Transcript_39272/g.108246  ORF Transcript_39272/g.108246 Transcript_39272/m.108246 type:complete len:200 (+) Transcript_39272:1661-2260(+)
MALHFLERIPSRIDTLSPHNFLGHGRARLAAAASPASVPLLTAAAQVVEPFITSAATTVLSAPVQATAASIIVGIVTAVAATGANATHEIATAVAACVVLVVSPSDPWAVATAPSVGWLRPAIPDTAARRPIVTRAANAESTRMKPSLPASTATTSSGITAISFYVIIIAASAEHGRQEGLWVGTDRNKHARAMEQLHT